MYWFLAAAAHTHALLCTACCVLWLLLPLLLLCYAMPCHATLSTFDLALASADAGVVSVLIFIVRICVPGLAFLQGLIPRGACGEKG